MTDAYVDDAQKLTGVLMDVTKRWCGNDDTVDARVIALGYSGALGGFLSQIEPANRLVLVKRVIEVLIATTDVPLRVETQQ